MTKAESVQVFEIYISHYGLRSSNLGDSNVKVIYMKSELLMVSSFF